MCEAGLMCFVVCVLACESCKICGRKRRRKKRVEIYMGAGCETVDAAVTIARAHGHRAGVECK